MAKQPTNQDVLSEVLRVAEILEGDPSDWQNDGVVGEVKKNSEFRKTIQKYFGVFVGGVILGNVPVIWFGSTKLVEFFKGLKGM